MSWISSVAKKAGSLFNDATGQTQQNEWNMQAWQMQNEYNSPAKQMERLRVAGLNPNLVYGGSGQVVGNATSAPQKGYSNAFDKTMNFIQTIYGLKNLRKQNQNLQAQTDSIKEETRLKSKNVELKDKELQLKDRELGILERTGMHPGVGSTIMDIGGRIADGVMGNSQSPVERAKSLGTAVRNAYEAGFPSINYDEGQKEGRSLRGRAMAEKAADKKGLKGKARKDYIDNFMRIYTKTH